MQIAGTKCNVCGTQIILAREGKSCAHCETSVHIACEPRPECPVCGKRYTEHSPPTADSLADALVPRALRQAKSGAGIVLLIVGLGGGIFLWRGLVHEQRAKPPSRPRGTETQHGVLIAAQGDLWWRDVEDAIRAVGTNALPSLLTLITQSVHNAKTEWVVAGAGFDALGSNAAPAVPALIELMDDARPTIRDMAVSCLASIGVPASNAVPKLLAALSSEDQKAQSSALSALAQIGGDAELLVPAFIAYLDGPHDSKRAASEQSRALWALKPYAQNSPAALAAFRRMTNASDPGLRVEADQLLWQIEHPPRPRQPGEPNFYRDRVKGSL